MLTKEEKLLVADALNGCGLLMDADPHYTAMMCGSAGALADAQTEGRDAWDRIVLTGRVCCGLEHELFDAIRLSGLDDKWQVNGRKLLDKIAALAPADREKLLRGVAGVWARNDQNFERDLEALAV